MISYDKFLDYMESFRKKLDDESKLDKALKQISPDFGGFHDEIGETLFLKMIKELVHDTGEDIDYFIYDLEWGKNWEKGCITTSDGRDIMMRDIDDLYNWLKENYNE